MRQSALHLSDVSVSKTWDPIEEWLILKVRNARFIELSGSSGLVVRACAVQSLNL